MSKLSGLEIEKRKLVTKMEDEIILIRMEYKPKIKAITTQINQLKDKYKKVNARRVKQYKGR